MHFGVEVDLKLLTNYECAQRLRFASGAVVMLSNEFEGLNLHSERTW